MKQGRTAEALAIYRWFQPLLDLDVSVAARAEHQAGRSARRGLERSLPRPAHGPDRGGAGAVEAIVAKAMANRPALPALRAAAE